jgi:hypothetical protein
LKLSHKLKIFAAILSAALLAAAAHAQTLTGTVTNGTSGKPAANTEVVLIKLAAGMEEGPHTKTDAQGKFSFTLDDASSPHLIRAIHQDVTYHKMAPPGTSTADLEVYDAAKKVEGVSVTADVMRIQTDGGQLETIRLFAINNASNPPKTQMSDHNFEFYLPEGAKIVQSMAKTANGQPINSEAVPQKERNRYAFNFPLRPGETQFQIAYQIPYSGSADVQPKSVYPIEHFVVMVPKSMQFTAASGAQFQSMTDPQQSDATVEVAQRVEVGQPLGFKVSGTGSINMDGTGGTTTASSGGGGGRGGPGGGLGPPIDAPDPLQKFRWYILGGFAALLALGALYVSSRQGLAARAAGADADVAAPVDVTRPSPAPPTVSVPTRETRSVAAPAPATEAPANGQPIILQALKEELFQLELEHKQGHISQAEYEKAKAALDATLERALKRSAQKA